MEQRKYYGSMSEDVIFSGWLVNSDSYIDTYINKKGKFFSKINYSYEDALAYAKANNLPKSKIKERYITVTGY